MKEILDAVRNGNSRERLSVLSDALSVLGVSLAAVIASLFSVPTPIHIPTLVATIALSLVIVAAFLMFSAAFLGLLHLLPSWIKGPKHQLFLWKTAFCLVYAAAFLIASLYVFDYLSSIQILR